MKRLKCVIMRGGTSKGVFFHEKELPQDTDRRLRGCGYFDKQSRHRWPP